MKSQIEDYIERVIDYTELDIGKDMDREKRKQTIKWATENNIDTIKAEINPIITKLNELIK